ncbi:SH3 domain-containing protein [Limimaricola variabilis]|uniref:SH3 domain-containing protein n=1 Tax=Limimaricola variabilis TaxID=1492771 RepID=UPI002AC8B3B0|nr:SH3 domain-containing protein [Limimaricola variabilis]WPY93879.1 SH3 domain-containing protein [Limimaricola variabilis]
MKHVFGIGVTFLLLGVGYYEMSGGADFQPQTRISVAQAADTTGDAFEIERTDSGIPVTAMREFPENVELISASFMPKPAAAATPAPAAIETTAEAADAKLALLQVSGDRVNMRQGPGTSHGVVDTLPRGTEARLIESAGGWAKIEITSTGQTGWMSERLLAPIEG